MKTHLYNAKGEQAGEIELPSNVFEVPLNSDLVHQVALAQIANRRIAVAHTKHRGEVSGGGKKPWAQKHTGRARHGSIRSPLWRKGGVVFGPRKNRNFKQNTNSKMRKKAVLEVLSQKAKDGLLVVLETMEPQQKTKTLYHMVSLLPSKKERALLVLPQKDKQLFLASRNIPFLRVTRADELNALDLLNSKFVIMPKDSLPLIEKTYAV